MKNIRSTIKLFHFIKHPQKRWYFTSESNPNKKINLLRFSAAWTSQKLPLWREKELLYMICSILFLITGNFLLKFNFEWKIGNRNRSDWTRNINKVKWEKEKFFARFKWKSIKLIKCTWYRWTVMFFEESYWELFIELGWNISLIVWRIPSIWTDQEVLQSSI